MYTNAIQQDFKSVDGVVRVKKTMDSPIIETFEHVLNPNEAAEIIKFAKTKGLKRSRVYTPLGEIVVPERTNTNTYILPHEYTPGVERIAKFVAKKTGYPVANQRWQIVHYKPGQQFKLHHDGPGWMYTMLIYLNTVSEGGETYFPNIDQKFKAVLGNGMLWKNYKVKKWIGMEWMFADKQVLHAGLPPKNQEKWAINVWVRDRKIGTTQRRCTMGLLLVIALFILLMRTP